MKNNSSISLKTNVEGRRATWLELFYDLIYVILIAKLTHLIIHAHHGHPHFKDYLYFALLFLPIWWAWAGYTLFANRFDTNDALQRIFTFAQMFFIILLATFVETLETNAKLFALSYFGIRFTLILMYVRVHLASREIRPVTGFLITGFSLGAICWCVSSFFESPHIYYLWALGMVIDIATPILGRPRLSKVSVHTEHLPERFGLLAIIVLGEAVAGIVSGAKEMGWTFNDTQVVFAGFVLACAIWWHYFDILENSLAGKVMKSGQLHIFGHLPIYLGIIYIAVGINLSIVGKLEFSEVAGALTAGLALFYLPLFIIQASQESYAKSFEVIMGRGIFISLVLLIGILNNFTHIPLTLGYLTIFVVVFVLADNWFYLKKERNE